MEQAGTGAAAPKDKKPWSGGSIPSSYLIFHLCASNYSTIKILSRYYAYSSTSFIINVAPASKME